MLEPDGFKDLDHYIEIIQDPIFHGETPLDKVSVRDLERNGRDIWNQCIRLKRKAQAATGSEATTPLWSRARLFALFLLDMSRKGGKLPGSDADEVASLVSLAITLSKICIFEDHLDTARAALQRVAEYLDPSKPANGATPLNSQTTKQQKLEAEYLLLRIILVSSICSFMLGLTAM